MITIFDCDVVENGDDDVDVERYLLLYCLPGVGVGAAGLLSLRLVNQVYHHHHHHHHHEGTTHDGRGNSVAVSAILKHPGLHSNDASSISPIAQTLSLCNVD